MLATGGFAVDAGEDYLAAYSLLALVMYFAMYIGIVRAEYRQPIEVRRKQQVGHLLLSSIVCFVGSYLWLCNYVYKIVPADVLYVVMTACFLLAGLYFQPRAIIKAGCVGVAALPRFFIGMAIGLIWAVYGFRSGDLFIALTSLGTFIMCSTIFAVWIYFWFFPRVQMEADAYKGR